MWYNERTMTKYAYFLAQVTVATPSACLVWPYAMTAKYGVVPVGGGKIRYAHQLAYEYAHGAIPPKWRVTQTCCTHGCFNPFHMEAVQPPLEYLIEKLKMLGLKKGPCEIWPYACFGSKYGNIVVDGRNEHVARVAYKIAKGVFPNHLDICHSCDNPPCFRPAHLFTGTASDNMRDCIKKGRDNREAKKHVGSSNYRATCTEIDVLKIRRMHAAGTNAKELLAKFHIGASCLNHIIHGRSWKHLL
jgi:hypothetical protein